MNINKEMEENARNHWLKSSMSSIWIVQASLHRQSKFQKSLFEIILKQNTTLKIVI